MTLDDTFIKLASFLNSLDAEGEQKFELSHSLVIICPDCGKNIAFRGRCPKCASNSWIPAGHTGGIFEQMKAQRLREMISSPDDTASMRGGVSFDNPLVDDVSGEREVAVSSSTPDAPTGEELLPSAESEDGSTSGAMGSGKRRRHP